MTDNKASKSGTASCGLYLTLPDTWMEPDFFKNLRDLFRAINASAYEKNNHVIELRSHESEDYTTDQTEIINAMCALTQSQGIVFIVRNNLELAKSCGADGVLIDDVADISSARALLGEDAIVGLRCGTSRRSAEKALEQSADYISFHDALGNYINPAIVQWWHYKSENPCLVEGRYTNDDCAFYVQAGADFIECGSYVWDHPDGVMKGVVNMMYAIDLASGEAKKEMVQ